MFQYNIFAECRHGCHVYFCFITLLRYYAHILSNYIYCVLVSSTSCLRFLHSATTQGNLVVPPAKLEALLWFVHPPGISCMTICNMSSSASVCLFSASA